MAWAINRLGAREAKVRGELLDAGAALREAQEQLIAGKADRAPLREAGDAEQAAVGRALDAVVALSEQEGSKLSPAAVERARQSLHAIALDEGVRRDFERHRLTTDHEPASLGGLGGLAPSSGAGGGRARPTRNEEREQRKRRREQLKAAEAELHKSEQREQDAQREVEAADKDAKTAQRKLERATTTLDRAARDAKAAQERVEELRKRD